MSTNNKENIKVLNLYAGLGGNRKLWENVDVTAIENDPEVARVYQDYFPNDTVIIADAHQYLLDYYQEFDFIWSSPPCQTHSKLRRLDTSGQKNRFPDMKLYEEVIFLEQFFGGKYVVENVIPYYEPLLPAQKIDRHLYWGNFKLGIFKVSKRATLREQSIKGYEKLYGYDLSAYNFTSYEKRQKLRNCVHPEIGLHVFNCAKDIITKPNPTQTELFEAFSQ